MGFCDVCASIIRIGFVVNFMIAIVRNPHNRFGNY